MTKNEAITKLLRKGYDEIGYLEKSKKAVDADYLVLWEKTKGAGKDNYTKFWAEIKKSFQGQAWCQVFAYWLFWAVFGETKAKKMLYIDTWKSFEPWDYFATMSWRKNFESHNARVQTSKAQPGDMVFFKKSHVGIVYKLDDEYLYTIEGNTSAASGVVRNGGCVRTKKYKRKKGGVDEVDFYGRPDWNVVITAKKKPILHKGDKGEYVKKLQTLLTDCGYSVGKCGIDGHFGADTFKAVVKFQKDNGIEADGVVGSGTWKKLEEVAEWKKNVTR